MTLKTKNNLTSTSLILTIVAFATSLLCIIVWFHWIQTSSIDVMKMASWQWLLILFYVCITSFGNTILIITAGALTGTVLINDKKVTKGICLIIFNIFSFGIWGLITTIKTKKKIKKQLEYIYFARDFENEDIDNYKKRQNELIIDNKIKQLKIAKVLTIIYWCIIAAYCIYIICTMKAAFPGEIISQKVLLWMGPFFFWLALIGWMIPTFFITVPLWSTGKITEGTLLYIFNGFTLGIWGYRLGNEHIEVLNQDSFKYENHDPQSLVKGYKAGKILGIIAILIALSLLVLPYYGWTQAATAIAAGLTVGIQEIRTKKTTHGICIIILSMFTLGIWPLVVAFKRIKFYSVS